MQEFTIWTYGLYIAISVALTIWVARTLHRHGRIFLVDTFGGNEPFADSINHLLVVGFYLINIGYITLALKYGDRPTNAVEAVEDLSTKLGMVLMVLGVMHFGNLWIFNRMRNKARLHLAPPPVQPSRYVPA
jgi:hypothetical protein